MSGSFQANEAGAAGARRGTLVLVVGASGVGKDTLIEAARRHFRDDDRLTFPQRVITRADQAGEPHIAVSAVEFESMALAGALFLWWEAHGLKYGIPAEARGALEAGCSVVVNASRTVIEDAKRCWLNVRVVHVTVGPEILRERLLARRREAGSSVEARIARGREIRIASDLPVEQIDNSGDLASAVRRFTDLLRRYADGTADASESNGPSAAA